MSVDTIPPGAIAEPGKVPVGSKPLRRVPREQPLEWTLPGFGPMTHVVTSLGEVPAQALRERDLVRTRSGQFKPIVWLDRIVLDEHFLSLHPDALPVHIRKDSLGRGVPSRDLYFAPNQPIDARASKLPESKTTARAFVGRPGVFRKAEAMYTYTLFHLGEPAVIQTSKVFVKVDP